MKETKFDNGTYTLRESETPQEEDQLISEFPSPFYANKTRQLMTELKALDPDLTVELLLEPTCVAILYVRDTSIFPPRTQNWKLDRSTMNYDSWAKDYARHLMTYWTRARERRNAQR